MKKTLLLTLATGALFAVTPAVHASPRSTKPKSARLALINLEHTPCAGKRLPAPDQDPGFRSYMERELVNPG